MIVTRQVNIEVQHIVIQNLACLMKFLFHSGSTCDYHFIIKELANEFEGPFECIGESSEIYKIFSVPLKKEVIKIDKDNDKSVETISINMKFIYSRRFMGTLSSKLVDNLKEGIHRIKCKNWDCFLEYESAKDNLIIHICLSCNKDYWTLLHEELKDKFKNTFKFSNININKFTLLLRKGIYPYEYMDNWGRSNETTLPEKIFLH